MKEIWRIIEWKVMENLFVSFGDIYEGDFKDDKMEGYGKCICTNKNIYKGIFKIEIFIL
jgi:hypothetical protein